MWSAWCSLLCSSQQSGFWVYVTDPSAVVENVQNSRLDGEEVLVLYLGTVEPHELCQAHQVFSIVARVAPAGRNLGSHLPVRGRAEVHRVVRSSDVDEGQQRSLTLLLRDELYRLHYVTPQHNLSHVQVLEGLFSLWVSHLIGNPPCASLQGKQVEKRYSGFNITLAKKKKNAFVFLRLTLSGFSYSLI